jgi:hypothetical protein
MCIPHTETNLTPTWSEYDGETFHRHGAIAYTFCENDDQEMLEARMAVTFRLTGSYDGVIDKREYYHAYMAEFRSKLAAMNAPPTNKNYSPTHEQMDQEAEDDDTVPNSQEDNFAAPGQFDDDGSTDLNRTPQKSAKCLISLQPLQQLRQSLLPHMRIHPNPPSTLSWHYKLLARSSM